MREGSFRDHVALLNQFLDRHAGIVDRIEGRLLNVQGKETSRRKDRRHFEQLLNASFFDAPGISPGSSGLKGQLAASHLRDGFEPIPIDQYARELDPLELIVRAYRHWDERRWPGRSGRLTFAKTIYGVFMLRQLEHLSLRIWDGGNDRAMDALAEVQGLLDRLNELTRPTALVRDARWLMQTAQGPLTRRLEPYFAIADRISESLAEPVRLGLHEAGARLAGGHLRSQLRYRVWNTGRPIDDPEILAFTRYSNSMDTALLVRDLVPLLEAYEIACRTQETEQRLDLADAILQGMSADPELYLTRLDLLTPFTMIEDLFIERGDDGEVRYTRMGEANMKVLERYGKLVGQLSAPLKDDAPNFDPSERAYSPYGIAYGFVADLLSNMAADALVGHPSLGLGLEDVFVSRGSVEEKLARALGWQQLPKRAGEREHFDHSSEWAGQMFARLMEALEARARRPYESNASTVRSAKLFVVQAADPLDSPSRDVLPNGIVSGQEYCFTSDVKQASAIGGIPQPRNEVASDRKEGRFLASVETDGNGFGISKLVLTLFTSQGKDVSITGAPAAVTAVLRMTCPGLVARLEATSFSEASGPGTAM